jgi:hypothetical protein
MDLLRKFACLREKELFSKVPVGSPGQMCGKAKSYLCKRSNVLSKYYNYAEAIYGASGENLHIVFFMARGKVNV